jgi:transposase InsO family protein
LFDKFNIFKADVENQLEKKIIHQLMNEFLELHGIIHQLTSSYSPQSNGIIERKNRTLMDMINAMLISYGLPNNLERVKPYILLVILLIEFLIKIYIKLHMNFRRIKNLL